LPVFHSAVGSQQVVARPTVEHVSAVVAVEDVVAVAAD
jgi:hypothetical protein